MGCCRSWSRRPCCLTARRPGTRERSFSHGHHPAAHRRGRTGRHRHLPRLRPGAHRRGHRPRRRGLGRRRAGRGTAPRTRPGRPGPRCSAAERTSIVLKALDGLDADADERADILSRENGKVRFEAAIDLHGLRRRGSTRRRSSRRSSTQPEHIAGPPFNTTITQAPGRRRHDHLPVQLAAGDPRGEPAVRADGGQHRDREAAAHHAAVVGADTAAPRQRTLPPGVLNVVTGADEVLGPIVVGDPRIRHVCFTGSVGGGKRIMAMAAANLTNVTLELGGNDPAIVLRRREPRRGRVRPHERCDVHDHRSGLHGAQAALRAAPPVRRGGRRAARHARADAKAGPGLDPLPRWGR